MNTISIGQLRQNPTAMIRAVQAGETYTLTDRGRPVAEIRPHPGVRWVPFDQVNELLRELGPDPKLAEDLRQLRDEAVMTDPYERER